LALQVLKTDYIESVFLIEGNPFRFEGREYFKDVYDCDSEEVIFKCGRQVEKSTYNSVNIATFTTTVNFFRSLYVAPTNDQVKVFSRSRLQKLYDYSQNDYIKENFIDKHCAQAVYFKELNNGSEVNLKHCYEEADNIRGISSNGVFIDEVQDIIVDAIPVILETQSHAYDSGAKMRRNVYSGTPKSFSNTIEIYWKRSTMAEYIIVCPHCNTPLILHIPNMRPDRYVCTKCGGTLVEGVPDPRQEGRFVKKIYYTKAFWKDREKGRKLKGFRISQLVVPWISPQEVWEKYRNYPPAQFHNEVLGLSYEDGEKPFTETLLNRITDKNLRMYDKAEGYFSNCFTYMGIDWGLGISGTGYTFVVVGAYNQQGLFQILLAHRFFEGPELERDYQMAKIFEWMDLFKIRLCVVDWGFGHDRIPDLKRRYGSRVQPMYYSANLGVKLKYDANKGYWLVNRSRVLMEYVTEMREQPAKFVWPGADEKRLQPLRDNHLAIQAEYRETTNGRSEELFFTHSPATPDDGCHAGFYSWYASKILPPGELKIIFRVVK
jgi:hypothetical protein